METFRYIKSIIPNLKLNKISFASKVFDWTIPPEWSVKEAYVRNAKGKKIIDIKSNNLHLVSYSDPFKGNLTKKELIKNLYTLPKKPDWIPYRTNYYNKGWGFCCKHNLLKSKDFIGPFEVYIDSNLNNKGSLVYAEAFKKGQLKDEILITAYCCHPSLANDNLSGLVTAILLFDYINKVKTRYSYRLVIAPETIGALCFLKNYKNVKAIQDGTVISCTAGPDKLSIKESFESNHWVNKISLAVIDKFTNGNFIKYPFVPDGSDERQYSSPAFRINTPSYHKSKYYEFKEYHTSADNLDFISSENLLESLKLYKKWFKSIDAYKKNKITKRKNIVTKFKEKIVKNKTVARKEKIIFPKRINMYGEFQLGKRGLCTKIGGTYNQKAFSQNSKVLEKTFFDINKKIDFNSDHIQAFNWLMHLCDGKHSNVEISKKSRISLAIINQSIAIFYQNKLIKI